MKVAIYIERGVTQLVLTPESSWETSVCDKLASNGEKRVRITRGSFYECQGGWFRFDRTMESPDKSLILRVDEAESGSSAESCDSPSGTPTRQETGA